MKVLQLLCLILAFNGGYVTAKDVNPTGVYAGIDTKLATDTIRSLKGWNSKKKKKTVAEIQAHPENYAPPVFYELSRVLFASGSKDEAAFWFYAGQLRATFDAMRCADVSARQAVAVLNQEYGSQINEYTFKDILKLEALIPKVIEWDRSTSHSYDHRWINLHGMDAVMSGMNPAFKAGDLSAPEDQWDAIAEKTRTDYLTEFQEGMREFKSTQGG